MQCDTTKRYLTDPDDRVHVADDEPPSAIVRDLDINDDSSETLSPFAPLQQYWIASGSFADFQSLVQKSTWNSVLRCRLSYQTDFTPFLNKAVWNTHAGVYIWTVRFDTMAALDAAIARVQSDLQPLHLTDPDAYWHKNYTRLLQALNNIRRGMSSPGGFALPCFATYGGQTARGFSIRYAGRNQLFAYLRDMVESGTAGPRIPGMSFHYGGISGALRSATTIPFTKKECRALEGELSAVMGHPSSDSKAACISYYSQASLDRDILNRMPMGISYVQWSGWVKKDASSGSSVAPKRSSHGWCLKMDEEKVQDEIVRLNAQSIRIHDATYVADKLTSYLKANHGYTGDSVSHKQLKDYTAKYLHGGLDAIRRQNYAELLAYIMILGFNPFAGQGNNNTIAYFYEKHKQLLRTWFEDHDMQDHASLRMGTPTNVVMSTFSKLRRSSPDLRAAVLEAYSLLWNELTAVDQENRLARGWVSADHLAHV